MLPKFQLQSKSAANRLSCSFLEPFSYSCCDSKFLYAPCGHIVTVNLNIIRNHKLTDLLLKQIRLKHSIHTRHEYIFCDLEVVRELFGLHENFDIVPADIAYKNYTVICLQDVLHQHLDRGSKIQKVPRGIQGEKSSKDMVSSRNLVSTIEAQAGPKRRTEKRVSVPCWCVTPVANAPWKPLIIR